MTGVSCCNSALTSEAAIIAATMIREGTLSVIGRPCRVGRIRLQCGRPGFNPWVGKIPWRRERLQYSGLENSMLYSHWGRNELDATEQLSLHFRAGKRRALNLREERALCMCGVENVRERLLGMM